MKNNIKDKIPGKLKDWAKVLVLMSDEAAIILVVLLVLHYVGVKITLPIKIGAGLIFIGFVFIRHVMVIPSFHRKQVTGREGMVGEKGRVVERLVPGGVIAVKGEDWNARSIDDTIETGEIIEIVGFEGLTLLVTRKVD